MQMRDTRLLLILNLSGDLGQIVLPSVSSKQEEIHQGMKVSLKDQVCSCLFLGKADLPSDAFLLSNIAFFEVLVLHNDKSSFKS